MQTITAVTGEAILVDDEDFASLSLHRWRVVYRETSTGRSPIYVGVGRKMMHRMVMNAKKGVCIDHRNGNVLDNRKENLRICSHAENMRNRAIHRNNSLGFKGVYKSRGRYRATIRCNGVKYELGSFDAAETAHAAYCAAAKRFHGEFARFS
jgi:hypothetical protein